MFEATMTLWGHAYGKRSNEDEPRGQTHPIAAAMQFGMTREQYVRSKIKGRDGSSRRTLMARGLAACGVRRVPASYVDPVRATDDSGRFRGLSPDPNDTPEVQWLQRAWVALQQTFERQAKAVLIQYQRPDLTSREQRARELGVSVKQWDHELDRGVRWMRCAHAMRRVVESADREWGGVR